MKKLLLVSLSVLSLLTLTGCDLFKKKEDKESASNKYCKDCVYNYYLLKDNLWENENIVGNKAIKYVKNYKELKDENGNQRDIFLGYVINDEEIIQKIYACIMVNNEPFCIEQSNDGSTYESNKKILQEKFSDCDYNYSSGEKLICNNDYIVAYASGNVGVRNEKIICLSGKEDSYCSDINN